MSGQPTWDETQTSPPFTHSPMAGSESDFLGPKLDLDLELPKSFALKEEGDRKKKVKRETEGCLDLNPRATKGGPRWVPLLPPLCKLSSL